MNELKNPDEQLIHSFSRNQDEVVQIVLQKYKGKYYTDWRVWFHVEGNPTLRPTKKGISFSLENLSELKIAMERLFKVREKFLASEDPKVSDQRFARQG